MDGILSVRYGLHDAYDRIVFDWPERVPYTVTNDGGLITIRFAAGARIDSDALAARLPSRLRLVSVDSGPDSLVVVIAAPAGARVQDFYNLTKTVVDIYRVPGGNVPVAVPAAPDQIAAAEPPAAEEPEAEAAAPAEPAEESVVEAISPAAEPAGTPAPEAPAPESESAAAEEPPSAADPEPEPQPQGGNVAALANLPAVSPSLRTQRGPVQEPQPQMAEPEPEAEAAPAPEPSPAAGDDDAAGTADATVLAATEQPDPATRSTATVVEENDRPASLDVVVIDGEAEALMRLRWNRPVRAAVVKRGDRIWIAFDATVPDFSIAPIEAAAGPVYDAPALIESEAVLAFSLRVDDAVEPRVSAAGNTWYVQMRPRRSETTTAVAIERFEDPALGAAVAFVATDGALDPGEPVTIHDPEVGDRIVLVPVGASGAGLAEDASFVQFHAIGTAQGLAFDRLSDEVVVRSRDDRVEVVASGGLTLSDDQALRAAGRPDRAEAAAEAAPVPPADDPAPAPMHAEASVEDAGQPPAVAPAQPAVPVAVVPVAAPGRGAIDGGFRIFEQQPWRLEQAGPFAEVSRLLQAEASAAIDPEVRAQARVRFARFLFGHGQFRDAGSVLRLIGADTPELFEADPSLTALRGATAYMNGDIDQAVIDLSDHRLAPSGEVQYWRAAALAAQGRHAEAEALYTGAAEAPGWYENGLRIPLALASVDTALVTGDVARAASVLDTLPYFGLEPKLAAEVAVRRAAAAWAAGETRTAEEAWEDAIASGFPGVAARAVFDRTRAFHDAGRLSAAEAAAALDAIRYHWRGGEFEFGLLRQLAEYQFASGDYRSGFRTLKQTRSLFTDDIHRRAID